MVALKKAPKAGWEGESMNSILAALEKNVAKIREKTSFEPRVALVLGSGLGGYADEIDVECTVGYEELDGFPVSTVPGHKGRFVFGRIRHVPVVVMQGRVHYYEGYSVTDVVMPIRIMGLLGAKTLLLTNAAGGINTSFSPGDFMLIRDHILWNVPSPLIGENIDKLGPRFPDMSTVYHPEVKEIIRSAARDLKIPLKEGVYIQCSGPNFETPAEIRLYGLLGADAVGMSTAVEAIAANHMGLRVGGISCISNLAAGLSKVPLTHEEVQETADKAAAQFKKLIETVVTRLPY